MEEKAASAIVPQSRLCAQASKYLDANHDDMTVLMTVSRL